MHLHQVSPTTLASPHRPLTQSELRSWLLETAMRYYSARAIHDSPALGQYPTTFAETILGIMVSESANTDLLINVAAQHGLIAAIPLTLLSLIQLRAADIATAILKSNTGEAMRILRQTYQYLSLGEPNPDYFQSFCIPSLAPIRMAA
jgi:hypothetical protein